MSGAKRKNKIKLKKAGKKLGMAESLRTYSEDMMELASTSIQNNQISYGEAEQIFAIPQLTIQQRIKKRDTLPEKEEENTDGEIRSQTSHSEDELKYECVPCKAWFQFNSQLKIHIRRHHFNRVGRVPYAETQGVDQVWYEKVENTDALVKISKVSENVLILQKINEMTDLPTAVISKEQEEVLDVRNIYPTEAQKDLFECNVCNKSFGQRKLGKHFEKAHPHLLKKKCDTCQIKFKRAFNCAKHVCPESNHKILKKDNDEWAVVD